MSAYLYGRMIRRRQPGRLFAAEESLADADQKRAVENADDDNKLATALAAIIPADVLAAHAVLLTLFTTTDADGVTKITDGLWLGRLFIALVVAAAVIYLLGRRSFERADLIRMLIPPLALVGWAALANTSGLTPLIPKDIPHQVVVGSAVVAAGVIIALNAKLAPSDA